MAPHRFQTTQDRSNMAQSRHNISTTRAQHRPSTWPLPSLVGSAWASHSLQMLEASTTSFRRHGGWGKMEDDGRGRWKTKIPSCSFELYRVQKARAWVILNFFGWLDACIAVLGPRNPQDYGWCCATVVVSWGCMGKTRKTRWLEEDGRWIWMDLVVRHGFFHCARRTLPRDVPEWFQMCHQQAKLCDFLTFSHIILVLC